MCSPVWGATVRIVPGVAESLMGWPNCLTIPCTGWRISTIMSRAWICGSVTTSSGS